LERPRGRVAYDRIVVAERPAERAGGAPLAAVGQDDRGVSQETGPPRPRDRRATEPRAKRLGIELEQCLERAEASRRPQRRLVTRLGLAIPRADLLAHVTAEEPLSDLAGELVGDVAAMLDRQVRDAAPRVEHVGRDERPRRARVETRGAGPAAIRLGLIERKLDGRQHDSDEEVRA